MSEQPKQYRDLEEGEIIQEGGASGNWRSMDTAPKDGTDILVWYPHSRLAKIASWAGGYWYNEGYHAVLNQPSHWQPLPEGPTE